MSKAPNEIDNRRIGGSP